MVLYLSAALVFGGLVAVLAFGLIIAERFLVNYGIFIPMKFLFLPPVAVRGPVATVRSPLMPGADRCCRPKHPICPEVKFDRMFAWPVRSRFVRIYLFASLQI